MVSDNHCYYNGYYCRILYDETGFSYAAEQYVPGEGFIPCDPGELEHHARLISKQEFQQGITTLITKNRTKR